MKKLIVAILMGGPSSEHEVSLESGKAVIENLDPKKYKVIPVLVDRRKIWFIDTEKSHPLSEPEAMLELQRRKVDVVFIAMHGEYGEDGTVQKLLSAAGIPYTGSKPLPSALAMNKPLASRVLKDFGFEVPEYRTVHYLDWNKNAGEVARAVIQAIDVPLVVKPGSRGSSIGVSLVKQMENLKLKNLRQAIDLGLSIDKEVVIQKFVSGREVTCPVLERHGHVAALEPVEIIPVSSSFFDYNAKYTEGASREITPPQMPNAIIKKIKDTAIRAHKALGCAGYSRTDMILGIDKKLYILEVNTLPGLTPNSLLPKAAKASGIKFPKLLDFIIEDAIKK